MEAFDFADVERALEAFSIADDPSDPRARRRLRILRVASECFSERGYRRTTVDQIAEAAGVAKGTVYLYFATKADLILHAIALEKRHYIEKIRPVFEDPMPPRERLRVYLRASITLCAEMPLISRLLEGDREISAVLDDMNSELRDWIDELQTEFLTRALEAAAPSHVWTREEIRDRARVLRTLLVAGVGVDARLRGGLSVERYAGILADMIVDGVGRR